jgi:hypothetical protein
MSWPPSLFFHLVTARVEIWELSEVAATWLLHHQVHHHKSTKSRASAVSCCGRNSRIDAFHLNGFPLTTFYLKPIVWPQQRAEQFEIIRK